MHARPYLLRTVGQTQLATEPLEPTTRFTLKHLSPNQQDSLTTTGSRAMADTPHRTAQKADASPRPCAAPSQHLEKKQLSLAPAQYLPERHKKDLIVLHFTAGTTCESAFRTWGANPERIATAYGVDPDGTIVEFFPPESWAYHLGVKGTSRHDQRSIGIEIANVGPLKRSPHRPDHLNWWPGDWDTFFCEIAQTDRYCQSTFRGIDYFAAMPTWQMIATGTLVRHLCERFSIPREASRAARNGDYDPSAFAAYTGVATHSNFRKDKWDVGPAFDWDLLGF